MTERTISEAILHHSRTGVVVRDRSGEFLYANPTALEILGGDPRERDGRQWLVDRFDGSAALDSPDSDTDACSLAEVLTNAEAFPPRELDIDRLDGTPLTLLCSTLPILDGDGNLRGSAAQSSDITDIKQRELAQRLAHRRSTSSPKPRP